MPIPRAYFPLTYWRREESIIAIGGFYHQRLSKVNIYSKAKNEWKALPDLPEPNDCSAAGILNETLYNFGGTKTNNSLLWLDLLREKAEWTRRKYVGPYYFGGWLL